MPHGLAFGGERSLWRGAWVSSKRAGSSRISPEISDDCGGLSSFWLPRPPLFPGVVGRMITPRALASVLRGRNRTSELALPDGGAAAAAAGSLAQPLLGWHLAGWAGRGVTGFSRCLFLVELAGRTGEHRGPGMGLQAGRRPPPPSVWRLSFVQGGGPSGRRVDTSWGPREGGSILCCSL